MNGWRIKQIIPAPAGMMASFWLGPPPADKWKAQVVCLALVEDYWNETGDRIVAVTAEDCGKLGGKDFSVLETGPELRCTVWAALDADCEEGEANDTDQQSSLLQVR